MGHLRRSAAVSNSIISLLVMTDHHVVIDIPTRAEDDEGQHCSGSFRGNVANRERALAPSHHAPPRAQGQGAGGECAAGRVWGTGATAFGSQKAGGGVAWGRLTDLLQPVRCHAQNMPI